MNDRITALEQALTWYAEQARLCRLIHSEGDAGRSALAADGGERARAALAASRAATDCHQQVLVTAAQVRIKPLVWEDFDGMGAKASAFYNANYLITMWRGRGQFEVALSYPGHQTGYDGERFHDTLEAAKAAAQADYEARILAALDLTPAPAVEPVADNSPQRAVAEIGNQIHNIACELHGNEDVRERLGALASEAWRISVTLSQAPPSPTAQDAARVPEIAAAFEAGAMAVHREWLRAHENGEGPPRGEPDFSEAASDYAALRAIGGDE